MQEEVVRAHCRRGKITKCWWRLAALLKLEAFFMLKAFDAKIHYNFLIALCFFRKMMMTMVEIIFTKVLKNIFCDPFQRLLKWRRKSYFWSMTFLWTPQLHKKLQHEFFGSERLNHRGSVWLIFRLNFLLFLLRVNFFALCCFICWSILEF